MPEIPIPDPLPSPEEDRAQARVMDAPLERQVLVCTAASCAARGSEAVLEAFKARLFEEGLLFNKKNPAGCVSCAQCGSVGFCAIGPAVMVWPDGIWYAHVGLEDVPEIVQSHLKEGRPVERLVRKRMGPAAAAEDRRS